MASLPKLVVFAGIALVLIGLLWAYSPGTLRTLFGWFGRLPGDIRYQSGGISVFVPWVSMLVVSLVLSVLLRLVR